MSTIKVTNIEHESTGNGGIQLDSSGHVTVDGQQLPTAGALSNRNIVINGAMQVAQRATSKTGLTNGNSGYHTVDRFRWAEQGSPTYVQTMSQSTDAPVGFSNSLKVETTTADTAYTSTESNFIDHRIEGQNLQSLAYGTSSAKAFTLSFWVKSNVTGTYAIWLYNSDNVISCTQTYTIDTANTWEYKTITVAGSTNYAITNDNGSGLDIRWILGAGPDFTSGTASTTWVNSIANANRYVGQTANIAGAVGNTWQITGVQLEVGEKATPFEHRSYSDELRRCQRYRYQIDLGTNSTVSHIVLSRFSAGVGVGYGGIPLPGEMRANPNFTFTGATLSSAGYAGNPVLNRATKSFFDIKSTTTVAANGILYLRPSNTSGSVLVLNLDAEL